MNKIILLLIRFYQKWISPALGQHCRFYPSCSSYAYQAFEQKNLVAATLLASSRLLKCHPLHRGGFDPLES